MNPTFPTPESPSVLPRSSNFNAGAASQGRGTAHRGVETPSEGGFRHDTSAPVSSGPLAGRPSTILPFDPHSVDDLDDAELDAIVHGVIALDKSGIILRYNLAEAHLARLDRHSVLGRHFFEEVAPCTRTDAFEGAFRRMVADGSARVERFAYLFDFKFGAQECDVEMVRAPQGERFYVFVTRRSFAEARSDLPEGWAAPLQQELLGEQESEEGVLRDQAEQRIMRIDADFLATLFTTAQKQSPVDWPRVCFEWGQRWGRRWIVGLEMQVAVDAGAPLQELAFSETMRWLRARLAESGWGQLSVSAEYSDKGLLLLSLDRSPLAELQEMGRTADSTTPASLLEGLFSAVFTHLSQRKLTAVSVARADKGQQRFLVMGAGLRDVAVALLAASPHAELEQFVSVLRASQLAMGV